MTLSIGIIVFDGVEELDFVGPWEVFTMATAIGLPVEAFLISLDKKEFVCGKGMKVVADYTVEDAPQANVILVPGGAGTRRLVLEPDALKFLTQYAQKTAYLLTVCTGSVLLGKTGLLDGRNVTTHWNAFDFLAEHVPNVTPINNQRVVVDGNLYASAGVSAGVDMSLKFIADRFDVDAAKEVQKWMEYHPEPQFGS